MWSMFIRCSTTLSSRSLSTITTRLRFMTGVLILPQRNPLVLAKQVATLDHLSGGRIELGIGVGWNEVEYEALGQDFHNRGRRCEEQIAVMRALWTRCQGGPMSEQDLLAVLAQLGGRSFAPDIARWVHGTNDLPLDALLQRHGVQIQHEPDQVAQQLGLRVKEGGGLFIHQVLRGGVAEKAGFASGDEWIAVQATGGDAHGAWRLQSLDDFTLCAGNAKKVTAIVSRDKRLLSLTLALPKASQAVRLTVRDAALVDAWLGPQTVANAAK